MVAITWLWLAARCFSIELEWFHYVMLVNSVWLVYAGDRVFDALRIGPDGTVSPRRHFAFRHRRKIQVLLALSALLNAWLTLLYLTPREITFGLGLLGVVLLYLGIAHLPDRSATAFPLKEIFVALLFTAGTLLFPAASLRSIQALALPAVTMFLVFLGNCVLISYWEVDRDRAEGQPSIALRFPEFASLLTPLLGALGVLILLAVILTVGNRGQPLLLASFLGALGLFSLQILRHRIHVDVRRTLADLVLLTPLALIALT